MAKYIYKIKTIPNLRLEINTFSIQILTGPPSARVYVNEKMVREYALVDINKDIKETSSFFDFLNESILNNIEAYERRDMFMKTTKVRNFFFRTIAGCNFTYKKVLKYSIPSEVITVPIFDEYLSFQKWGNKNDVVTLKTESKDGQRCFSYYDRETKSVVYFSYEEGRDLIYLIRLAMLYYIKTYPAPRHSSINMFTDSVYKSNIMELAKQHGLFSFNI